MLMVELKFFLTHVRMTATELKETRVSISLSVGDISLLLRESQLVLGAVIVLEPASFMVPVGRGSNSRINMVTKVLVVTSLQRLLVNVGPVAALRAKLVPVLLVKKGLFGTPSFLFELEFTLLVLHIALEVLIQISRDGRISLVERQIFV